ncbi:hypothetical protein [Methanosarcina barkeri]|uniref:hypothetical protein n=1 Tax=Methanosarcina barkeri TaxID=2208 RepID=UPI0012D3891D|nr:hypothetical protein [Methanosarcina barkeri]
MAAILLVSIACIPAVSASPNKDATNTVSAIGTPAVESLKKIGILATVHINQGASKTHTTYVGSNKHHFDPYLIWIPSSGSLRLTITSPTGQVYGPWTDSSDGSVNGMINFDYIPIESAAGLAVGNWVSTIYCISGPVDYSYTVTVT